MPVLPPLLVRLEADVSNFTSKLGLAEKQVQRMSRGNADDFDKLATVGKAAFLAVGAAAVGLGAISIKEALEQEAANARLTTSLHNVGSALTANSSVFQKAQADARQLGFADEEATDSLAKLTAATKSPAQALRDLSLAQDVARGRNIDLASATDILTKVETGHVALLGRIGINVKDATGATISQEEALRRLSALYGGQAQAFTNTFAGRMAVLKAETSDVAEKIGFALIPKVEALVEGGSKAIDWAERNATAAKILAGIVAGPLVLAMGAYIVTQIESIGLTVVQVASKLPQFFLTVGSAIQGATAAEVVLNETTAVTNATMLTGAGVVGLLAARFGQLAANQLGAKSAAQAWAQQQVIAAGGVEHISDAIAKQQKEVDFLKSGWGSLIYASQPQKLKEAEDRLKALKDQANKAGDSAKAAAAAMDPTLTGALGNLDEGATSAADTLGDLWSATKNFGDLSGRVAPGGSDILAQADATDAYAKATADLTSAQKDLNDARRQAPIDIAKANADVALAADDAAKKVSDLAVATEKYGVDSLEAKTAADQLTKSRADAADAAKKAGDLGAAGGNSPAVVQAEQRIADLKKSQTDALRAQVTANETLKRDRTDLLFSQEKEQTALDAYNKKYGATLSLADAYNGKLQLAVEKQERLILDQLLLNAAQRESAYAPQSTFVSDSPSARGKTVAPTHAPLIGPVPGTGGVVQQITNISVFAPTNADPNEIAKTIAFQQRARG